MAGKKTPCHMKFLDASRPKELNRAHPMSLQPNRAVIGRGISFRGLMEAALPSAAVIFAPMPNGANYVVVVPNETVVGQRLLAGCYDFCPHGKTGCGCARFHDSFGGRFWTVIGQSIAGQTQQSSESPQSIDRGRRLLRRRNCQTRRPRFIFILRQCPTHRRNGHLRTGVRKSHPR